MIINLASASIIIGNASYEIKNSYAPRENIAGWINISLNNELGSNFLTSNYGGGIKIIDLLKTNSANYNCTPIDCKNDYSSSSPQETKTYSMGGYQEKIIAVKMTDKIQDILNFSFDLTINNQQSCTSPFEMDILNDNITEFYSYKFGESYDCVYGSGRGCFDSSSSIDYVYIGSIPYCEKINLSISGKFQIGAWVRGNDSFSNGKLKMLLYNLDGDRLTSCNLSEPLPNGGEISCIINYTNEELTEHYVCIISEGSALTGYAVQKENTNSCGFYAFPGDEEDYYDYNIFARGAKFGSIGNVRYNEAEYAKFSDSSTLKDYILDYVDERYNKNCSLGCVIPIKLKSNADSSITISNLSLVYSTSGGPKQPEKLIYDSEEIYPKLKSGFLKLDLKYANISVGSLYGNQTLVLTINNTNIANKAIIVIRAPIINFITPSIVGAASPTTFSVNASSPENKSLVKFRWDFGDNSSVVETSANSVVHTYSEIKDYSLEVEIEDSSGQKSRKIFTIKSMAPEANINWTIKEYKGRLSNITSRLALLPAWYKILVEQKLEVNLLTAKVNELERQYKSSSNSSYVLIMQNLTSLRVPIYIRESNSGEIPFAFSEEDVDLAYLREMGAGNYSGSEGLYKSAAEKWFADYYDALININYIYAVYDSGSENLMGIIDLKLLPKLDYNKNVYMIIKSRDIKFDGNYNVKNLSGASGIEMEYGTKELKFAVMDFNIEESIVYLSPKLEDLPIENIISGCNYNGKCDEGESNESCPDDCKPWGTVLLLWLVIGIIAVGIAIFLVWWYSTRYERHLFKSRTDMFNLINFVKNARQNGMSNRDIREKLKENKWSGEQIDYVFKKV